MSDWENLGMEEWEQLGISKYEYSVGNKNARTRKIFNKIILANEEFQGEWLGDIIEYLGDAMLYRGNNEDFIRIEVNSSRMRLFILLLKLAIKKLNDENIEVGHPKRIEVLNWEYFSLADAISSCKLYFGRKDINKDDDVYEYHIEERTSLISNYSKPIESSITGKKNKENLTLIDVDSVNDALTLYLESNIRDKEIDLLFFTLFADSEIIGYIADVGKSKYWSDGDDIKKMILEDPKHYHGNLEREEKAKRWMEKTLSGDFPLIMKWIIISVSLSFAAFFLEVNFEFIPDAFGIGVLCFMFLLWIVVNVIDGSKANKMSTNFEKYFPVITLIQKMEHFYFTIRQKKSTLFLRDIKKELSILADAGAVMPDGMMKIIKDMEKRGIKWF